MEKKGTMFCKLYDILVDSDVPEEEREQAWRWLLPIESNIGFSILIAAKYSWREIPNKYKEKAWQELLKRDLKNDSISLQYLSVNAPEPWCERARKLQ
jgi:hypothetical protein